MKRLYYVARTIDEADALHAALRAAGVGNTNYHVVSKDDVGIYKHHFHPATPLLTNDVIRQGERFGLLGIPAGIVVALIITGVFNYFHDHLLLTFVIVTTVVAMHGAWMGGMVGLQQPSQRLRRFRSDIDAGHYLFIVDVDRKNHAMVKERLGALQTPLRGEDRSSLVMPFG